MGKHVRHRTRRPEASARWAAWLTVLAVLFNTLAPALHASALASPSGEAIEICTPAGLKRIVLSTTEDGSTGPGQSDHGGTCQLCPACPLCPSPTAAALPPPPQATVSAASLPEAAHWTRATAAVFAAPPLDASSRPRAPPPSL